VILGLDDSSSIQLRVGCDDQSSDLQVVHLQMNLTKLFNNTLDFGWRKINEVLEMQSHKSLFNIRVNTVSDNTRCKKINLGGELSIYLLVDIIPIQSSHEISIIIQVHTDGKIVYLPSGLQFNVLDLSGHFLQRSIANQDRWMRSEIIGKPSEEFAVVVRLNNYAIKCFFTI
jgi:hypothetical protein